MLFPPLHRGFVLKWHYLLKFAWWIIYAVPAEITWTFSRLPKYISKMAQNCKLVLSGSVSVLRPQAWGTESMVFAEPLCRCQNKGECFDKRGAQTPGLGCLWFFSVFLPAATVASVFVGRDRRRSVCSRLSWAVFLLIILLMTFPNVLWESSSAARAAGDSGVA